MGLRKLAIATTFSLLAANLFACGASNAGKTLTVQNSRVRTTHLKDSDSAPLEYPFQKDDPPHKHR